LSATGVIFEHMFDMFGDGSPEGWEPIPDEVLDELGGWDDAEQPGLVPCFAGPNALVELAAERSLGVDTLPLIASQPFTSLGPRGHSLALRMLTELTAHIEALRAEVTAVIAGPKRPSRKERVDDFSPHEIAVASKCSVYAADTQIAFARDLSDRLTATAAAMRDGRISHTQAKALSEATCHLDVEIARDIERKLLLFSHRQDTTLFRAALRRWLAKLDPAWTERAVAARKECVVSHTANTDGTGELYLRGPLEITTQLSMALTAYAAKTKAELGGTADQRKVAGLRDLSDAYLSSPQAPTHHGRPPSVHVTVDLLTLLGLRNHPAEIPGIGAVPADVARWLLADGAPLRRLIIDPMTGHLLDYGQQTYLVPPALADYLIAKNIRSAAPHSNVDSRASDMEHNIPHDQGGPTNPINNTPVDRRWHRAKTHGDWTYVKHDDGTIIWTSPTGLTCQIDPYDYRAGP
jgi:hypothetical protein